MKEHTSIESAMDGSVVNHLLSDLLYIQFLGFISNHGSDTTPPPNPTGLFPPRSGTIARTL